MIGSKGKNIDLEGLLKGLKCHSSMDLNGIRVKSVTADSRQVGPGALFVAVPGTVVDGRTFIQDAVNKGCVAVLAEQGCKVGEMHRVPLIQVQDSREALGRISATFFGNPGGKMKVIGITGTNGKTTCTYLLESVIKAGGGNPGVIGTVNYRYAGKEIPSSMTTPEPVFLQGLLQEMLDAGVTHIIMEVSSHALDQKRHAGLLFDVALFTNLSRDHLDYHKDMKSYFTIKSQLFTEGLKKMGLRSSVNRQPVRII
ncbi:MAG: hypothetical protein KKE17_13655 [Proteobacteria bacterium]|nr:hypothetical protein [Pseudomonadota bacterium]MBU1711043.1 hypothetical protein [Pseudomonadota bacterium]